MSEAEQSVCPICTEAFESGELLVAYRIWPRSQLWGHADCVESLSIIEDDDDE
jgi:hypothetical protein